MLLLLLLLLLLSHFSHVQLCATHSPPGSPIPGILQARTLEWVAISFSNAWKWKVKVKSLSHVRLLATPWTAAHQAPPSMGFSRQEYWSGVPLPSPIISYSNFQIYNTVLLAIVPKLYIIYLQLIYFITVGFHSLIPFTHLTHFPHYLPLPLCTSGNQQSVLYIHELSLFVHTSVCFVLDTTYKWDHTIFVFLWLTYFS